MRLEALGSGCGTCPTLETRRVDAFRGHVVLAGRVPTVTVLVDFLAEAAR
jgi:hypothetical protein